MSSCSLPPLGVGGLGDLSRVDWAVYFLPGTAPSFLEESLSFLISYGVFNDTFIG
jgi:hypothetical protein